MIKVGNWSFSDIVLFYTETNQIINLTKNPMIYGTPNLSPDGKWLAVHSSAITDIETKIEFGTDAIFLINIATQKSYEIVGSEYYDPKYPSWSPDGSKIVFQAGSSLDNTEIYIIDPNGSNAQNITQSAFKETHPVWSRF